MTGSDSIRTLADLPRVQARVRGAAPALVQGAEVVDYALLDERSNRVANGLAALGLAAGERAAVLAKDSPAVYEILFGAAKAGVVSLGVNWRLAAPEVAFILRDSGARVLFAGEEYAALATDLAGELPELEHVIVLGAAGTAQSYGAWREAQDLTDRGREPEPDELAALMYTSGTTGQPKGVMLPHRSFFAVVRSMRANGDAWIGWGPDDVSLMAIPSFHIGGVWWAMTGLAAGSKNVMLESFIAWQALEAVEEHGVTVVCLVPAMIQLMLDEPTAPKTDFASLKTVVYGGSPIPAELLKRGMEAFGCGFAQIYGLTETGNTAVCMRPEEHLLEDQERLRAAGRPYPDVRIEVADAQGAPVAVREIGEIRIWSPANMLGYWKRPEATAETLRDGWVVTGDAGYLDEHGFVHICDRLKDMIIYAGENVYPAEVESALASHAAVAEVAVIGVPHERWGECVKALVVKRAGAELRAVELVAHARRLLADFKVPASVEFVETLPRTPSGKLKKAELRRPYWEGRERQVN